MLEERKESIELTVTDKEEAVCLKSLLYHFVFNGLFPLFDNRNFGGSIRKLISLRIFLKFPLLLILFLLFVS
jgi:hypothetical protein